MFATELSKDTHYVTKPWTANQVKHNH